MKLKNSTRGEGGFERIKKLQKKAREGFGGAGPESGRSPA